MGFYEQLRGLMCQNRGLLNTREQSNRGKYQARTTNLLFYCDISQRGWGPERVYFRCFSVNCACVFDCTPGYSLSLCTVQGSWLPSTLILCNIPLARQRRAVSDIDFTFTKHFQDGLLALAAFCCLNHFLVPVISV